MDFISQCRPPDWEAGEWEFFLDVWTALALQKQVSGINRGLVDRQLVSNWKRHFTNYANQQAAPSAAELKRQKNELDKEKKTLPETMKEDIENKRVKRAVVQILPEARQDEEREAYREAQYAQIKFGDPR
jgi:hypothetical protein